jgi:acyl-CoA thioesterase
MLRAALAELGDDERSPRSLTLHYLRPPGEGEVRIEVAIERSGRRFSTVSLRLSQGGKLCVVALLACATLQGGLEVIHREPPHTARPQQTPIAPLLPEHPPLRAHFERRPAFGGEPWQGCERAVSGGWIRLQDPPDRLEAPLLAAFCDVWPPALFAWARDRGQIGGVPTVDLTIHFRCDPRRRAFRKGEFVLVRFEVHTVRDGCLVEDGEIWSEDGALLAQSRQLAVLL